MRKIFALLALVLGVVSCQTEPEGFDATVGGEKEVNITVSLPEATRANSALGAFQNIKMSEYDIRYFFQVFNEDGTQKKGIQEITTDDTTASFPVRLIPGRTYKFVVWAHLVDADGNAHYAIEDGSLEKIVLTGNWNAMDESRDAYTCSEVHEFKGNGDITLTLKRPFAKLRVITTDMLELMGVMPTAVEVEYTTTHFNTYNALTKTPAGELRKEHVQTAIAAYDYEDGDAEKTLFTDYFFATAQQEAIKFNMTIEDQNGDPIGDTKYFNTAIPVQRNYLTTIAGNILTTGDNITVTIDDEFENGSNWNPEDDKYDVEVWDGESMVAPLDENNDNIYEIERPSELAWLAAAVNGTLNEEYTRATVAANDFSGKTFILTQDIDLGNEPWTPIGSNGNIFKGTFDGNNKKITNLFVNGYNSNAGLFGVTHDGEIKNFTLENAKVSGRLNVGAVAGQPYTTKYTNITVQGHVEINGMAYVGGVGGKNAYADWDNITVNVDETSYVKANSIENGTAYRTYVGGVVGFNGEGGHSFKNITSNINVIGSTCDVGGLFGIAHYGNQFENCVCTGNVEIYAAEEATEAEEIGGIAGVWHNQNDTTVTMTNVAFTGNVTTNIARETEWYNNLVGKPYSATGTGKLVFDNVQWVGSAAELQAAVNAATGNVTIRFGNNIEGEVVVVIQKPDVKITIDGASHEFNGYFKVHSNSEHYASAAVTFENIKFVTSTASVNFIEALENGAERYSTNITAKNCTFTATGDAVDTAVGLQIKSSKWAKAENCTATGLHSLVQAQSCDTTVDVIGCNIDGKNGVAFKQVKAAKVEGTTIVAREYGIRFDGNTDNYGIVVKDNNITAAQPFIVRKMTGKDNTIALEGTNTLTTEETYQIVITNGSDDAEYAKPTGTYALTGADDYLVYPRDVYFFVATWDEFTAALAANEPKIKLTDNIEYSSNYQLQKDVVIDLNDKSMTLPMINIHKNVTIKNGTINGKVYARKNSEIVFNNVKFSGAVADNLSTEGHLAIQGGCKSLYAKDCLFSPTSVSGSQTKPLSFEGGSTIMKFEGCEFKSSPYKKQVYFNSLSATAKLDFTNCNFNNKTPNIMFAAACPLTNLTMSGTTKLSSVTLETNRAKDAVTAEDLAYLRESLIANNSMSSVRLFYAGGSSEYIR